MTGRFFACLAPLLGCARLLDAPVVPSPVDGFSDPQLSEPAGLAEDPPQPLRLLPGDVIRISAFSSENAEYAGIVVDGTGKVHVPLAGDVDVGGLTLADAERRIEEAMRALDRVVRVGLSIAEYHGHRATVVGAVTDPGRVQLHPGMRLADLYAEVGGALIGAEGSDAELADISSAQLVRSGSVVPVSLQKALEGDARHNVFVYPGDHLFVPVTRRNTLTVFGAVNGAGVFPFRSGIRLTEALARAGGVNDRGDHAQVRILRGPLREPRVYQASVRSIMRGRSTDIELAAGDVVYVTEEWTAHVGEVLSRLAPLLSDPTTVALAILLARSP